MDQGPSTIAEVHTMHGYSKTDTSGSWEYMWDRKVVAEKHSMSIMFSFLGRMGSLKYWIASTKTAEESI